MCFVSGPLDDGIDRPPIDASTTVRARSHTIVPTSDMGPMIDKANVARVNQIVEDTLTAGAKAIVRGGPVTEGLLARGAFYRPTFLEVTDSRLPIVQEETFGPLLTMQVFDTETEAVALANDCEYGLAASIWTRDVDRPLRIARQLQVGTVWINDWVMMRDEFERAATIRVGEGACGAWLRWMTFSSTSTSCSTPVSSHHESRRHERTLEA